MKGSPVGDPHPATLALAPDGGRVAVGSTAHGVDLLNLADGALIRRLEAPPGWSQGAWTPDGRRFVAAGADGKLRIWDPASGSLVLSLPLPPGPLEAMALAPDGRSLALAGQDLTIWEAD